MFLRELYEAKARRVVAIMPGGFHPFHPGHKSLYDWAVKTFGQSNVYVAATADTSTRPFPFDVKKKLAAMAGVPGDRFLQVKSPFNNREYADLLDGDTALVFVRSQKDKNEQPLPDQTKKNGEPGYLRTYTGKDLNTADEMGYMAYGPTINFDFSGMKIKSASELRATWPEMSDEDKLRAAKLMYGNGAPVAVKLLNQALGDLEAPVGENLEEAQMGDVYMRFKVKQPLDKSKGKPTLMAFAGFANTPSELTLDTAKMNFNVLNKKQDIVNAIKKVIGDKIFIGAEKVVIYVDGAVNPKKFPQYGEFLAWVDQFGKEKVKIQYKPQGDDEEGEKGPGKKRVKQKWANPKDYKDDKIETTKYFTIDNARLMKFLQKSAPTIMQAYRPAAKQFVMEPAQYKAFRNWMRSPDVVSKFGETNVRVDKSKSFSQSVGREFEHMEDASPEEEDDFHTQLDKLVHKYFGHSSDEKKKKKKTDEIMAFGIKRGPKRATIKKKPEKFEPSLRDKIAARRKAAAQGDKDAWASKKELPTKEAQLDEIAPAVGAVVMWILRWALSKGLVPALKWLLKKLMKYIIGGTAAAVAIDQGWEWIKDKIGEEATQILIDNGFEIAIAVTLVIGAVVIKKWIEKHGEKLAKRYAESIEEGDLSWTN